MHISTIICLSIVVLCLSVLLTVALWHGTRPLRRSFKELDNHVKTAWWWTLMAVVALVMDIWMDTTVHVYGSLCIANVWYAHTPARTVNASRPRVSRERFTRSRTGRIHP